jgi:hypothetical protein
LPAGAGADYIGGVRAALVIAFVATTSWSATARAEAPEPWVPVFAFGAAGAGLVVGTLAGLATLDKNAELEARCPSLCSQAEIDGAVDIANVSTAGFAFAAVGAIVGTVTLVVRVYASDQGYALEVGPDRASFQARF